MEDNIIKDYKSEPLSPTDISQMLNYHPKFFTGLDSKFGKPMNELIMEVIATDTAITKEFELSSFNKNAIPPERAILHEQIVNEYLELFGAIECGRQAIVIIGSPAVGKSDFAAQQSRELGGMIIDSDLVMTGTPVKNGATHNFEGLKRDFNNGIGALKALPEASYISTLIRAKAIETGQNLILPIVGANEQGVRIIGEQLKKANYNTTLVLLDLPTKKTFPRNINRYFEGKELGIARLVTANTITSIDNKPVNTFCNLYVRDQIKVQNGGVPLFKEYKAYSTDIPKGKDPIEIDKASLVQTLSTEAEAYSNNTPNEPAHSPAEPPPLK